MRALALFSGGLDSLLSIKTIKNQHIDVVALHFDFGFNKDKKKYRLQKLCDDVDTPLEIVDIKHQFFDEVLFSPKYGYGKYLNPCIDCHGNMFKIASSMMERYGASFLISGEVIGQRPKSQRRGALELVEKLADTDGLILRPLSAKLLKETIPENNGWVDREKLFDFCGRGRSRQIALAKDYGLEDFESPAGGCMLTEEYVTEKIKDFSQVERLRVEEIPFVTHGRYFVLPYGARFVLSRNKEEGIKLKRTKSSRIDILEFDQFLGPVGAITLDANIQDIKLALEIMLTYSKVTKDKYTLKYQNRYYDVSPLKNKEEAHRYIFIPKERE